MSQKRVFFLTGSRLAVYQGRRNPVETQVFQDSPAGLQAFAGYLDREPWAPVCLLLDLVEEEFRTESIPHVFGPDRRALVANRQRRLFQHTPYRYAVFQDQETSGRRDDNVLFAAVPRPDILRRWLHPITQRKIPLIGIYSLPILSRKLLRGIQAASPESVSDYALLVHCNADGGLRQSFFLRRHLKVSRLAVLPGSVAEAGGLDDAGCLSADILGEVEKTHHYLNGLRLLPVNHPLDVCFLSGAPTLASLAQQVTDTSNIRYHFIDIAKVGAAIGLSDKRARDKHRTPHADPLFVRTLVRTVPANHYATPKDVRYFRFLQMRMAMYVIGVVLLSAGIGWGALQFSDALITRQKTVALKEESHIYEDRYARARRANLPDTPVDAPSLKAAVEVATILRTSKITPYPMFMALGAVLDGERALEIREIEWSVSADLPPANGILMNRISPNETGKRLRSASNAPSVSLPAPRQNGINPMAPYQIALIKGQLVAFSGDYRQAIALVENFAKRLSRLDRVEHVEIVRRPLDVSSEEALAGKAGAAVLGTAGFTVRIVLRNEV